MFLTQVGALIGVRELVGAVNVYMQECDAAKTQPSTLLLKRIALYVTHLFKVSMEWYGME